jgi:phosphate transport system substrate-binding protein
MNARKLIVVAVCLTLSPWANAGAFFGAGASFPKDVYNAWGKAYKTQADSSLVYTAVGSGKGLSEIIAAKTDFGASDKPFSKAELDKNHLFQFPSVIGGVVPVVNLKGVANEQLQLDSATLAAIYLGKITRWNDPAISAINPGIVLPSEAIVALHRDDKSGTSFNFTHYLTQSNADWKAAQGEGFTLAWKGGVGADGADDMSKKVAATPNAIGYVDFTELRKKKLTGVKLRNSDGLFVAANLSSFTAAARSAKWSVANGFNEVIANQPGKDSWPITAATFIVLERTPQITENGLATLQFFDWAYGKAGDDIATELSFVPLPDELANAIRAAWRSEIKDHAGAAIWK